MNAILMRREIDFYNNVSQAPRFYDYEYDTAVRDVVLMVIEENLGELDERYPMSFQWNQQVRDNLQPLIKDATPSITNGTAITNKYYTVLPSTFTKPTDYYMLALLMCTIDGYTTYARPMKYNEEGPLFENSFMYPSNVKPYYNENSTGFTVWRSNSGTFTTAALTYIKQPSTFTIGKDSQLINAGTAIVSGSSYIATAPSVQNGVTYQIGDQFTAVGTALTSGQVILASNTTAVDLPEKLHAKICKMASDIMMGTTRDFDAAAFSEREAQKS